MALRVTVIGAGKLGAAFAAVLARTDAEVSLWARKPDVAKRVAAAIGDRVRAVSELKVACAGAHALCFAVPTQALRTVARAAGEVTTGDQVALHACRGVDAGFFLPHEVLRQETCLKKIGALGGPLYLDDAERGRPLVTVVASRFDEVFAMLRALVKGTPVRVHATHDLVGVELCGAISNVAQIAAGLAEGCGLPETDQGTLLVRGLAEAMQLGLRHGAERSTFMGLAGVGDLIPRQVTSTRNNRELGREIGRGRDAAHATGAHEELEGPITAREARELARNLGVKVPLIDAVDEVLWHGAAPLATLERLLALDLELDAERGAAHGT
jgi:glycerol-3-phosphate dehydrogenase (NAD(P)+)